MESQFILEEKTNEYMKKNNLILVERTLWNNGAVVYEVESINQHNIKEPYSLVVIYLENENISLKDKIYGLYNSSKEVKDMVQCFKIDSEETENGQLFFILTEIINPVIDVILDGKLNLSQETEEEKKITLYKMLANVCNTIMYIKKNHADLNIYINNEELCIDSRGNGKLLLFDLIKNQMATYNEAYELAYIGSNIAKALKIDVNIPLLEGSLESFQNFCIDEIAMCQNKNEKNKNKYEINLKKAIKGNKKSQYIIGYMYEHGKAVPKDINKAMCWYEKSAAKKYTRALNNLAYFYQKGMGTKKDIEKAEKLLLISAKQKDSVACLNLAIMYQTGKKGKTSIEQAMVWYRKSMKYGNKTAERMYKRLISQNANEKG